MADNGATERLLTIEYEALRSEILTAMSARSSVLSFGFATVGALVTAVAALYVSGVESVFASLVMAIIIPVILLFVLLIWLGEYQRMHRAGTHLIVIEKRINSLFDDEILTWETKLREGKKHMGYPYDITIILILGLMYGSFFIGVTTLDIQISVNSNLLYICGALASFGLYYLIWKKMSDLRS